MAELLPVQLIALAAQARAANIAITIDAEEADRLDLDARYFRGDGRGGELAARLERSGSRGAGISEARDCRCSPGLANSRTRQRRRIPVRLVKGAYWDTEIKRAQEQGLADYPFSRAKLRRIRLLSRRVRTLLASKTRSFRNSQPTMRIRSRRRGAAPAMALRFRISSVCTAWAKTFMICTARSKSRAAVCRHRIYAPVGTHEDLLAYLVRRCSRTAPIRLSSIGSPTANSRFRRHHC